MSEAAVGGLTAEHGTVVGLSRRQEEYLVEVEGSLAWGWGAEGDLQVTR